PTTKRENRSRMTASYSLPLSAMTNSLVSPAPAVIRAFGNKLLTQQIRGDWLIVIAVGGDLVPLAHACFQPIFLQQSNNPVATNAPWRRDQIVMDTGAAVVAASLRERRPNQHFQAAVFLRASRLRPIAPGVEAAPADVQIPTKPMHAMLGLLRGNESKPYRF